MTPDDHELREWIANASDREKRSALMFLLGLNPRNVELAVRFVTGSKLHLDSDEPAVAG